jgi:electron transfer flavoprotein alpha/beta subunit
MTGEIARVHVDNYEPMEYGGEAALEAAVEMARQMREDFPGAVVGVSYNPAAADSKRRRLLTRLGLSDEVLT